MRVLLLGGTGNLGQRLIPALLAHGHEVTAYVRSVSKLRSLITPELFAKISIEEGDALDTAAVEQALRKHNCNAIMNTAGTQQILGKIATAVSSAAIRVGRDQGEPIRAWFMGGMGSLDYPGTGGWRIRDYMPTRMTEHHQGTESVLTAIPTTDLEWSLLCVAFMRPAVSGGQKIIDVLSEPKPHSLAVAKKTPPHWRDSWIRYVPFVGAYLNLIPVIMAYTTKLEEVADLLAEDFDRERKSHLVGELIGMKEVAGPKSS